MGRLSMTYPQSKRRECSVDGQPVRLRPMEFNVLWYMLMRPPGHVVPANDIVESLWTCFNEPDWASKCLYQYMTGLQRKGVPIQPIHGQGYILEREGLTKIDHYWAARHKLGSHNSWKYVRAR